MVELLVTSMEETLLKAIAAVGLVAALFFGLRPPEAPTKKAHRGKKKPKKGKKGG